MRIKFDSQDKQQGIVLISGLIFLMILTMIGIASMGSSSLTEKMTQNLRDISISFQASEGALGDGESWLKTQTTLPNPVTSCTSAPCNVWQYNAFGTNFYQNDDSWWQANAKVLSSSIGGVAMQPYYIIEQYSFVPNELSPDAASKGRGYYFYRITARGSGATSTAHSVVQSIFVTNFN